MSLVLLCCEGLAIWMVIVWFMHVWFQTCKRKKMVKKHCERKKREEWGEHVLSLELENGWYPIWSSLERINMSYPWNGKGRGKEKYLATI